MSDVTHVKLSRMVESDAPTFDNWRADNITTEKGEIKDLEEQVRDYLDTALMNDKLEIISRSPFRYEVISDGLAQMQNQMGVEPGSDESTAIAKEIKRRITVQEGGE